ncbi:VPS9 domain-containing protein 1-like isoform 2-T2 [Mergus octosetaceus]
MAAAGGGGGGGGGGAGPGRALQAAMRAASGALEMDSGGRPGEAYVEYLKSITLISQALQDEALTGKAKAKAAPQERGGGPAPVSRHRRVFSDEGGKLSPFLPPEIFQKLQIAEAQAARKELTPLEEASLQNQKLKAAYEARVARLNPSQAVQKTSLTLSLQRQMMENLVIAKAREETLQRKMEERRLRLQEAANRRFSSSVALTPEEQEQRALYAAVLEYEQDHDWPRQWKARLKRSPADLSLVTGLFSCLLSFPEHPIAQLLRKLQCAVYTRLYPAVSQSSPEAAPVAPAGLAFLSLDAGGPLPAEPGGRRLRASRSLHCMFSVPEHGPAELRHSLSSAPLADSSPDAPGTEGDPQAPRESSFEDLERFLASPEDWPLGEPPAGPGQAASLQEQLKGVVRDIHNAIDRLLSLTLLAFEGLNTAAGKDQCLACIEEAFFPPLWAPLLALYRSVHRPREAALARSMERHRNASPAELGLPSRLFPAAPGSSPAYSAAVEDLRLIPLETCPRRKLDCIVRALRSICECAEEYCSARDSRAPASGTMMCAGPAVRQEYRRSLEQGRLGACPDPSFTERLRQRLRAEPGLLRALQDDAGALLARGLRGRRELESALRGLAAAFELLERAALNLYLFPWRKEFGTVQTFSGAYVHSLRAALPEADLLRSFRRLGYARQDEHRLAVCRRPLGTELAAAACGFFACRLECEILAEVLQRLRPRRVRAEELLEARSLARDAEACVEMLRELAAGGGEAAAACDDDDMDLYQEMPENPGDGGEQELSPPAPSSRLWRDPMGLQEAQDMLGRSWDLCEHSELGRELLPTIPKPDASSSSSSSCFFLEQELRGAGGSTQMLPPTWLPPGEPPPGSQAEAVPLSAPQDAPELPCYQLHSCLRQGALPSYCCTTCQQLHAGTCAAGRACRSQHRGQELRGERQQRLWLQRTEVDMLLADSSSARP